MSFARPALRAIPALLILALSGGCREGAAEDPPEVDDDEVVHADLLPALGRPDSIRFRGRIVVEEKEDLARLDETTPLSQMSQDEVEDQGFELRISGHRIAGRTDGEGRFDLLASGLALSAGEHDVELGPAGGAAIWGSCRARVLPDDPPPVVVTSDIDLTYLVTDFQSTSAKSKLLRETAAEKSPFPGAPELYRAIAAGGRPIVFLSGSPDFFQRTLEARFRMDRLPVAGLHLKDMKGRLKSLDFSSLTDQIGYKLEVLLAQRATLPPATQEVLLGDDSEADFVAYSLYRDVTDGTIQTPEALEARLRELDVPERARDAVVLRARALADSPRAALVQVAVIRRTTAPNAKLRADDWLDEDVIGADDSFQIALVLADRGLLSADDAHAVLEAMVAAGQDREIILRSAETAAGKGSFLAETLRGAMGPR